MVKDFAKASMTEPRDLPKDVARVLYVLTIVRGQASGERHFTTLDAANVERETRRCLTFGWLPEQVREWLRAGLRKRRSGSG
jgi:hypothetical protein